ncbi:MAG TPA: RluA family pseudouridine synthase [Chloroflexota bacterium]
MSATPERRAFEVTPALAGQRLDVAIARALDGLTRSQAGRLLEAGSVRVDGAPARPAARLRAGSRVEIDLPAAADVGLRPEPIPLRIVHRDDAILVVDKPAGLVVHPAPGHPSGTLVNALLAVDPELAVGLGLRPGIVHRLDRDTSGLIVVARDDTAMAGLRAQWQAGSVLKLYLALVEGRPREPAATIEAPIGRDRRERKRMAIDPDGRAATSHYRALASLARHTLLEVRIDSGRTHQIRVHMASIGHPVAGDRLYGGRALPGLDRQFLHSARLGFSHPTTGEWLELEAPLPADLAGVLARLR